MPEDFAVTPFVLYMLLFTAASTSHDTRMVGLPHYASL